MSKPDEVKWSLFTRIIHWVVAVVVFLNTFVVEEGDPPHRYMGYAALIFIGWRCFIGVFGKEHEKFVNFPIGIANIKLFLNTHFTKKHDFQGHNPLASLNYLLIWLTILGLGITGWMMGLDRYFGEEWLEDIHGLISNSLNALVAIHLLGLAIDSYLFKRKSWLVMITGKKN